MEDNKIHITNGCDYGQPDGPDDQVKECDCPTKKQIKDQIRGEIEAGLKAANEKVGEERFKLIPGSLKIESKDKE